MFVECDEMDFRGKSYLAAVYWREFFELVGIGG